MFAGFETGGGMLADLETEEQREADLRWAFCLRFRGLVEFGSASRRMIDFIWY